MGAAPRVKPQGWRYSTGGTTVPREQCLAPYVTYGLGRVFTQDTAQLTHT
jgi:hypothetical protein